MPMGRYAASSFLLNEEMNDRKNARVIDKVMVALPLELSLEERKTLIKSFVAEIGQGQIPWIAALHQTGKDEHNPHAHIIIRDRHIETGRRVARLSYKGSTEFIRWLWEEEVNIALADAGHNSRVDARSLKDQGIKRKPQIHIGPNACEIARKGIRPGSQQVQIGNRIIDYPQIDNGMNRSEYNASIIRQNNEEDLEKQLESVQARIAGLSHEIDISAVLSESGHLIPEELKVKLRIMIEKTASIFWMRRVAKQMEKKRKRKAQKQQQAELKKTYVAQLQRRERALQAEVRKQHEYKLEQRRQLNAVIYMRFPTDQRIVVQVGLKDKFPEKAFKARLEGLNTSTLQSIVKNTSKHSRSNYGASELRKDTLAVKELLNRSERFKSSLNVKQQQERVKSKAEGFNIKATLDTAEQLKATLKPRKRRRRKRKT